MVRNSRLALARVVQDRDSQIQDGIIKLRELGFSEICVKIYEVACKEKCSMSYACILVGEETGCDMHVEWNELVQIELFLEIVKCVDSGKICFWEYIKKEILSKGTKKLVKITSLKVSDIASGTKNNTSSEVHSKEKPEIDILSFLSKEELEVVKSNIITLINNNYLLLESIKFIKLSPFFFKNLLKIDSEFKNILIQLIKEKRKNKGSKIEIDPKVLGIEDDDTSLISSDFSLGDSFFENPKIIESLGGEDLKKRKRFGVFKKSRVSQFCDGSNLYTRDEKEIKKIIIALLKIGVKIDEILLDRIPITSAFLGELLRKDEKFFKKFKEAYIEGKENRDSCTPLQINEIFKISKKQIKVDKNKPPLEKVKKETPKKPKTPRKYEPKIVPDNERKRWRKIPRELFVGPIKPKGKYTKRAAYWADDSIPKGKKSIKNKVSLTVTDTEITLETKKDTPSLVVLVKSGIEGLYDSNDNVFNFFKEEGYYKDIAFTESIGTTDILTSTKQSAINILQVLQEENNQDGINNEIMPNRFQYTNTRNENYKLKREMLLMIFKNRWSIGRLSNIQKYQRVYVFMNQDKFFKKLIEDLVKYNKTRKSSKIS